jgi:hypothetical protein
MVYDGMDVMGEVLLDLSRNIHTWDVVNRLEKEYGHSPSGKVWYCIWKQSANSKEIAKLKKLSQAA